jgi:hypothetical protein
MRWKVEKRRCFLSDRDQAPVRRALAAAILAVAAGSTVAAGTTQSIDCSVECGDVVAYTAQGGSEVSLRRMRGAFVEVLFPEAWLSDPHSGPKTRRLLIDGADLVYQYYRDLTGVEPAGDGLLRIAFVADSTCELSCSFLGRKGMEINDDSSAAGVAISAVWAAADGGRVHDAIVAGMARNFAVHYDYFRHLPGGEMWLPRLLQSAYVFGARAGTLIAEGRAADLSPDDSVEVALADAHWRYLADQSATWERCVERQDCWQIGLEPIEVSQSIVWRIVQMSGPDALNRYFNFIRQNAPTLPAPTSAREAEDLNVEALAFAMAADISCLIDHWKWYASPALRARLARSYSQPGEWCYDADQDSFPSVLGDCDDRSSAIHPGTVEAPGNHRDDNCNGLIDEAFMSEETQGDFSTSWERPTNTAFPFELEGRVGTNHTDILAFSGVVGQRCRLRLCFSGQLSGGMELGNEQAERRMWTSAGTQQCRLGFGQFGLGSQNGRLHIVVEGKGSYTLTAGTQHSPWPPSPWARVEAVNQGDGSFRFTLHLGSAVAVRDTPTLVKFWVANYGFVGAAGFASGAYIDWRPPQAPTVNQLNLVRAVPFAGRSRAAEPTAPTPFGPIPLVVDAMPYWHFVGTAANSPGANGTSWMTDLELHNPGAEAATVSLYLLPKLDNGAATAALPLIVGAAQSVRLANVVGELFHSGETIGAIVVRSSQRLVVTSRTFNNAVSGTYGQRVPGLETSRAVREGDRAVLPQLASGVRFRTNLGLVNATAHPIVAHVDLYSGKGSKLGSREEHLGPYGYRQANNVLAGLVSEELEDGYAIVTSTSLGAEFFTWASVIDNVSGDPIHILPATASTDPIYVATSAHSPGSNNTEWRTDLVVHNPGPTATSFRIELLEADQDNSVFLSKRYRLDPGCSARHEDVLAALFGFTGSGALRVVPIDGPLAVSSRTYNRRPDRTYGQSVAGIPTGQAIRTGQMARLAGLAHSSDLTKGFRTNLGLVNLWEEPIEVEVTLCRRDGVVVGVRTFVLQPYSAHQENKVFATVTSEAIEAGYAVVSTLTPDARFVAYASIIDNRSGDPIYLPAQLDGNPGIIEDAALDACVRRLLLVGPDQPLRRDDVRGVRALACRGVGSLKGLDAFIGLEDLALEQGTFSDVSPLAALARLRSLYLERNRIKDITPLARLDQLDVLSIRYNQVSKVAPFSPRSQIRHVALTQNQLTDLRPWTALAKLMLLEANHNQLTDLTTLVQSAQLLEELFLEGNRLGTDQCANLKTLAARPLRRFVFNPQQGGDLVCPQ